MKLGLKQNFIGIDVSDTSNEILVKEEAFESGFPVLKKVQKILE
jgi:hypothetical protein